MRRIYILLNIVCSLGEVEGMVSVRGGAQRATAGRSTLLIRPPRVSHIPRYFLQVNVVLLVLAVFLREPVLNHLVDLQVADLPAGLPRALLLHY